MYFSPPRQVRVSDTLIPLTLSMTPLSQDSSHLIVRTKLIPHMNWCRLDDEKVGTPMEDHVILGLALKYTSMLIFLTLLWVTFTLLESIDNQSQTPSRLSIESDPYIQGVHAVFGNRWVECFLNAIALLSWAGQSFLLSRLDQWCKTWLIPV